MYPSACLLSLSLVLEIPTFLSTEYNVIGIQIKRIYRYIGIIANLKHCYSIAAEVGVHKIEGCIIRYNCCLIGTVIPQDKNE